MDFPRTIPQAQAFQDKTAQDSEYTVINLSVDDEVIVKRITGRIMCKDCGAIYNLNFSPPVKENECDQCSGKLYQREDDKVDVVEERLVVYHQQTAPVVDFYKSKGYLLEVDGTMDLDKICSQIMEAISSEKSVGV